MSRYVVASDLHLGNHRVFGGPVVASLNERARLTLEVLQELVDTAKAQHANLIIAGDLFDTTKPSPQLVAEVLRILSSSHVHTYVLVGNHDLVSAEPGDHALGPLDVLPEVTVVSQPCSTGSLLMVPFRSGPVEEWLPKTLEDLKPRENQFLVMHMGIIHKDTPPFLKDSHGAIKLTKLEKLVMKYRLLGAASGDWHQPHDFLSACSYQIGSGCPTGFDDANRPGRFLLVDTTSHRITQGVIKSSPIFLHADSADHAKRLAVKYQGHPLFVRAEVSAEDVEATRAGLAQLEEDGAIRGGEVVYRTEQGSAAAQAAAVSVRGGASVAESVAAYVEAMTTDVPKDALVAAVLRYLGGNK